MKRIGKIDRVSSVEQKELALSEAGVSRRKVYLEIKNMLEAVKTTEELIDGQMVTNTEPDLNMRARGVELAMKAFGDMKEFERVISTTTNTAIVIISPTERIADGRIKEIRL